MTERVGVIIVLALASYLLFASQCVDAAPTHGPAERALPAGVGNTTHADACVHDLLSLVPAAPERPLLGSAVLAPPPETIGSLIPIMFNAPPPDYPRAMARALLQVYRI